METPATETPEFDRVFVWRNTPERRRLHGRRCRVVAYGSRMYSALVEFEDGERVVTSRRAVRRVSDADA